MPSVRIEIVRYTDDWQPGFVECRITDAAGRVWSFEEKVPLVTDEYLDATSAYPRPGSIGCAVLSRSAGVVRIAVDPLGESFECEVPASAVIEDAG